MSKTNATGRWLSRPAICIECSEVIDAGCYERAVGRNAAGLLITEATCWSCFLGDPDPTC